MDGDIELSKHSLEKYDRQLRLWGKQGQIALAKSKVLMIGSDATASETLKNLVLPGFGFFCVLDDALVEPSDLGNNFFLTSDSLGKPRAEVILENLLELNPDDVKGSSLVKDPVDVIRNDMDYFSSYSFVIVSRALPTDALELLAERLYEKDIPLVIVRSNGFLGYLRIVKREHTIVESKPEHAPEDLRMFDPFPTLREFVDSYDLESIDAHELSHVPFFVILMKTLEKWRKEHGGEAPSKWADKKAFKAMVKDGAQDGTEENFHEAVERAIKCIKAVGVPDGVSKIMSDPNANVTSSSSEFWVLVAALRRFVSENDGKLPVHASLPDFTSESATYIHVQQIYKDKADQDVLAMQNHVHSILKSIGREPSEVPYEAVKLFCQNCRTIRVVRYRSLKEEFDSSTHNWGAHAMELAEERNTSWYFVFRGVDQFYTKHGRFPGSSDEHMGSDVNELSQLVLQLVETIGLPKDTVSEDNIKEAVRYGGCVMHNVAAFQGGIASQEIIKLITHQWIPANNTVLFNGIDCSTTKLEL